MTAIDSSVPGEPVSPASIPFPPRADIKGSYSTLTPISRAHAQDLFTSIGGASNASLWTYLPRAAPSDVETTGSLIDSWVSATDCIHYAVLNPEGEALGVMAWLAIVPEHRRLEIGWVCLGPRLQKTRIATEAFYLLMRNAFELGYDRVEWKANALNEGSLKAAGRLGFTFEGIFRKHIVCRGKRRDTAWFSVTDDEWPIAKKGLEAWLDEDNFDASGKQKRDLKELRESFK